jgi:hypothetical protein
VLVREQCPQHYSHKFSGQNLIAEGIALSGTGLQARPESVLNSTLTNMDRARNSGKAAGGKGKKGKAKAKA